MTNYSEKLQAAGYYHVYNRACGFDKLFIKPGDYRYFLDLYQDYLGDYLDTFTYCLIPNHFHFLVRVRRIEYWDSKQLEKTELFMSKCFSNFFNSYAKSFNFRYGRKGNLFTQNFRRKSIDSLGYLRSVVVYIHRNPLNHGIVENMSDWKYSSYPEFVGKRRNRICNRTEVLNWFGSAEEFSLLHNLQG